MNSVLRAVILQVVLPSIYSITDSCTIHYSYVLIHNTGEWVYAFVSKTVNMTRDIQVLRPCMDFAHVLQFVSNGIEYMKICVKVWEILLIDITQRATYYCV